MRQLSENGLAFIKGFETFEPLPYDDGYGYPTVGYGHLILPGEDFSKGLTEPQAAALFERDLMKYKDCVLRRTPVPLEDGMYDALVSLCFNIGTGAYGSSTLRRMVVRGDHAGAIGQFPRWNKAAGRVSRGLTRRRYAEAQMYAQGLRWLLAEGD